MAPWVWSVVLLLVGIGVVAAEMFVPSGGVLGVLAGFCFVGGIVVAFTDSLQTGFIMLGITTLAVPVLVGLAIQWWPHTPIGRRILIPPPDNPDDVLPDTPEYRDLKLLVGRRGRSRGKMLPGGIVVIDHRSYEANSVGMAIEAGVPVEVVAVNMSRLVVRPCEELPVEPPPAAAADDEVLSRPFDALGIEDPLR
jgi:membrane-bound ClpP family serine protease